MSVRADIIDLLDNATEESLEKIFDAVKKILQAEKVDKVYTIDEIKNKAVPIAKKYGLKKLALFGSYARGDADKNSDVDFLYSGGTFGGFGYFEFLYDLENKFKCHVDAVSYDIADKKFLEEIKKDEVILYEV